MGPNPSEETKEKTTEIWRILFLVCIGAVMGIIGWGVTEVTGTVRDISTKQDSFFSNFQTYVVGMEHRVSVLENYQRIQDEQRVKLEQEFDSYRRDHDGDKHR